MRVISSLNVKFATVEFRVTLPKHHAGIGAVERIIESIKNTVSKSILGPHQLRMDDEELLTWIHLVIDKINNRPLILGAPVGITLTPNHILLGFRNSHTTIQYRREVGGRSISINRHLSHLYPFMGVEKAEPQE